MAYLSKMFPEMFSALKIIWNARTDISSEYNILLASAFQDYVALLC
mgnify:CR=1 FL=1